MNIENHVVNSKKALDLGRDNMAAGDYVTAMTLFAAAYAETRELMDHAWRMRREADLAAQLPGENTQ